MTPENTRIEKATDELAAAAQDVYDRDINPPAYARCGMALTEGDRLRAQAAAADARDERGRRLSEALRLFHRARQIDNERIARETLITEGSG